MTSKEHIESLRRHEYAFRQDGTTKEIPEDFLETTTKMLSDIHARKITYSIKVPEPRTDASCDLGLRIR